MAIRVDHSATQRALRRIARDTAGDTAKAIANAMAGEVTKRAKRGGYGFTDRTGRLRASIRATPAESNARGASATAEARAPYAGYVEFGHGRRYSYLGRALRELRSVLRRLPQRIAAGRFRNL